MPEQLCYAKGRLYLVEQEFPIDDVNIDANITRRIEDGELKSEDEIDEAKDEAYRAFFSQKASDVRGHRVLVLSLQGEILHVITHPTNSMAVFTSICCFDGKLMAAYEEDEPYQKIAGVLALQGL